MSSTPYNHNMFPIILHTLLELHISQLSGETIIRVAHLLDHLTSGFRLSSHFFDLPNHSEFTLLLQHQNHEPPTLTLGCLQVQCPQKDYGLLQHTVVSDGRGAFHIKFRRESFVLLTTSAGAAPSRMSSLVKLEHFPR